MRDLAEKELELHDKVAFIYPNTDTLVVGKIVELMGTTIKVDLVGTNREYSVAPKNTVLLEKYEWPDVCHESHKNTRSSDASSYDMICDDCGLTDFGSGAWGQLRKPCKGVK